jgi:hypothetical protein
MQGVFRAAERPDKAARALQAGSVLLREPWPETGVVRGFIRH